MIQIVSALGALCAVSVTFIASVLGEIQCTTVLEAEEIINIVEDSRTTGNITEVCIALAPPLNESCAVASTSYTRVLPTVLTRSFSLPQSRALTVPTGMHVTIDCQAAVLNTRSEDGRLALEDESKLSIRNCAFTNFFAGEAMTFDASTSKNVDTSLFGSNPDANVSMISSFLEVPCSIISLVSEGGYSGEYIHGPVVGSPAAGETAAVTFRELRRSASDETGPELEFLNVTAWCGPDWQDAELTAAAALEQASVGDWTSHGTTALMGRRADAGSTRSANPDTATAEGDDNVEKSEGKDDGERGWKRPLAVAGGVCTLLHAPKLFAKLYAFSCTVNCPLSCSLMCSRLQNMLLPYAVSLWLVMALMTICVVHGDKKRRTNADSRQRHQPSASRRLPNVHTGAGHSMPAPTSGSDVTTGVVTPRGSPMLGAQTSVANMLFNSGGDGRAMNGSTPRDGHGMHRHSEDRNSHESNRTMRHVRLSEQPVSSSLGVVHSAAQPGKHPSPVSSSGEPFLPNFGMDIGTHDSHSRTGDHVHSSAYDATDMTGASTDSGLAALGRSSHRGDAASGSHRGMHSLAGLWQEPTHTRPPVGTMHEVHGHALCSVDSELVRSAAGVGSPHRMIPAGTLSTSSHLVQSQHSEVDGAVYMQAQIRDNALHPSGSLRPVVSPQSAAGNGVRRMKDAVHRAMMEMQHDMHEPQLQVYSVLGRGGYGTVYHGQWKDLEVAIKTVIFQSDESDGVMSSLASEAAIASNLSHRNIVSMFSHDICNVSAASSMNELDIYKFYMIQEFCNGGSLRHAIAKGFFGPATLRNHWEVVLGVLSQVADAISYLHSKSICHGDLNPANVLFKYDSSMYGSVLEAISAMEAEAKVGDFGLSRKIQHGRSHASNTRQGTPFFVAPEVAGQRRLHKSSDAYSFGVMMWELFVGCPVYTVQQVSTSRDAVEPSITRSEYLRHPSFPQLPPHVPPGYAQMMTACLSQHPQDRPPFTQIQQGLAELRAQFQRPSTPNKGKLQRSSSNSKQERFDSSNSSSTQARKLSVTSKQTDTPSHLQDLTMRPSVCDSSSSSVFSESFGMFYTAGGSLSDTRSASASTERSATSHHLSRTVSQRSSHKSSRQPSPVHPTQLSPSRHASQHKGVGHRSKHSHASHVQRSPSHTPSPVRSTAAHVADLAAMEPHRAPSPQIPTPPEDVGHQMQVVRRGSAEQEAENAFSRSSSHRSKPSSTSKHEDELSHSSSVSAQHSNKIGDRSRVLPGQRARRDSALAGSKMKRPASDSVAGRGSSRSSCVSSGSFSRERPLSSTGVTSTVRTSSPMHQILVSPHAELKRDGNGHSESLSPGRAHTKGRVDSRGEIRFSDPPVRKQSRHTTARGGAAAPARGSRRDSAASSKGSGTVESVAQAGRTRPDGPVMVQGANVARLD